MKAILAPPDLDEQALELTWPEWGAPTLTLEQYKQRERLLRQRPLTTAGRCSWVLVDDDVDRNNSSNNDAADIAAGDDRGIATASNGRRELLAFCETVRHSAVLVDERGAV
eukprot:jgi/Hompol1/7116/HPOL_005193-RA